MKVTALLTGRGNNTLKDKNLINLLGRPVLYYPAKAAKSSSIINDWYCSSDDENILKEAQLIGYSPIMRPQELALPDSQHIDCILHALEIMQKNDKLPDILIVLLANNITVKSEWITECVDIMLSDMTVSSVTPVYADNDHHPLRAKRIDENGKLIMYNNITDGKISTNRQDLPECVFLSHNFWVLNVGLLLKNKTAGQPPWTFMGNNIFPYKIPISIDIHNEMDLYIAEKWIKDNYED